MKKTLRFTLLSMLMMLCGTMWAGESSLTFTAACNGSGTAGDGAAWTITSDGEESNFDTTKGIHYGTGKKAVQYIQLTTNSISGTISKVVVNASTANNVTATVGVTVGGNAFGGDAQTLSSSATEYTFNGGASGEIVVTVTKPQSANGALYVKSIVVTYTTDANFVASPVIAPNGGSFLSSQEVTLSCTTEGAKIYYTLDGNDPTAESTEYTAAFTLTETTTVKAIAVKGEESSDIATATFTAIPTTATLAELITLDNEATFAFGGEAIVVAKPTDKFVYIKDATASALIYEGTGTKTAAAVVGKTIAANWTGKVSIYSNLVELVPDENIVVKDGDAVKVTYPVVTVSDINADNINKVVTLKGITSYTVENKNITINVGETEVKGYNQFGLEISAAEEGKTYEMVGAISINKNNIQFQPIEIKEEAAEPSLIVNGSFEQCDAVAESIGTSGNAQGTDYEAAGWKLAGSGAWCNAAVFAYGSEAQLNGVNIPAIAPEACGEKALGVTVGWGAAVTYQSAETVTLPAGEYVLLAYAYNSNNDAQQMASKLAFVPTVGDAYVSAVNSYPSNTWSVDYVTFTLTEETEGNIQIGGGAISGGSGSNAKTFFDNIILTNSEGLASAQQKVADANEAIRQAKIAVNAALVEGAALDNPVTAPFIINGTFDQNINGWTCTGGFQNKALASNQQGDFTVPFFENWNPDAKENKIYQTVQNIPNGVYKLKIAAFVNILADPNESQFVFANNDKVFLTTGDPTFYEVYTKVEDNTLEVGFEQTTATANWMGIDNVSLIYFGNECTVDEVIVAAPRNDYLVVLAEANGALADEAYNNVTGEERTALSTAIETIPEATKEGYEAATATLTNTIAAFKNAKTSYDALADANAQTNIILPYALASKKPEAKVATTAAAAETAANEVYSALRAYYESNAKAENVEGAEDKTALITNPDATDGNNGWTIEGNMNNPRSNESWTDSEGNNSYMYFDGGNWGGNSWTTTMKQTVTLPIGKYLLTAKGRASENVTTTLSVGEVSTEMAHVGSTGNIFARGWADSFIEFETPNNAESEQVEIVVTASANAVHEWFSVGDFRLTKLMSIPTGIETMKAETAQKAIFNLNGQKVMKAQKGLYILNGKKVVVK